MLKLFVLLLIFSCSSYKSKQNHNFADQRVSSYLSHWKKENSQIEDRDYKKQYSKYLQSVEKVFLQEGMVKSIDYYLDSLKAVDKSIKKGNQSYSELYSANNPDTKRTRVITELYDDLIAKRADSLLDFYGFNFYSELMKNRNDFMKKEKETYHFPL